MSEPNSTVDHTKDKPHPSWLTPEGETATAEALSAARRALRRFPGYSASHDDWAHEALARLRRSPFAGTATAKQHVVRIAREVGAEQTRKVTGRRKAAERVTGSNLSLLARKLQGGQSSQSADDELVKRRFKKTEERRLRAAVEDYCLEQHRKRWGRGWEPEKFWRRTFEASGAKNLREMLDALDHEEPDIEHERQARDIVDELTAALERARRFATRMPRQGEAESHLLSSLNYEEAYLWPATGGAAVRVLCASEAQIVRLTERLGRLQSSHRWSERSLWRFVALILGNPVWARTVGCAEGKFAVQPNVKELAIICLLAGFWPGEGPRGLSWPEHGRTVKSLVRTMEKTVGEVVKATGNSKS